MLAKKPRDQMGICELVGGQGVGGAWVVRWREGGRGASGSEPSRVALTGAERREAMPPG